MSATTIGLEARGSAWAISDSTSSETEQTATAFDETAVEDKFANLTLSENENINWITGSRSAALPMILQVSQTSLADVPALVPTGMLLEHSIVPLTGEVERGVSEGGVNRGCLSGMNLTGLNECIRYATQESFIFDPKYEACVVYSFHLGYRGGDINRLKVAVLRLILMNELPQERAPLKEHLVTVLNGIPSLDTEEGWEKTARYVGVRLDAEDEGRKLEDSERLKKGQLVSVPGNWHGGASIGMVVGAGSNGSYAVTTSKLGKQIIYPESSIRVPEREILNYFCAEESTKAEIQQRKEEMQTSKRVEALQETIGLFDTVEPIELSEDMRLCVEQSFPLIWASYTVEPLEFTRGRRDEKLVQGVARLGQDIQLVFTDAEHVDILRRAVSQYGVEVRDFDAAHHIAKSQHDRKAG